MEEEKFDKNPKDNPPPKTVKTHLFDDPPTEEMFKEADPEEEWP